MTLNVTTQYKRRMAKKYLGELKLHRSSMEYYTRLSNVQNLPHRKSRITQSRLLAASHTIQAVEEALALMSGIERRIIELHYFEEHSFDEIEEIVHLEHSSVYRYHAQGLDKIALVLYGD